MAQAALSSIVSLTGWALVWFYSTDDCRVFFYSSQHRAVYLRINDLPYCYLSPSLHIELAHDLLNSTI